jgi:C-terminal processing protease CtpA/Prc
MASFMKFRTLYILLVTTFLGAGLTYYLKKTSPQNPQEEAVIPRQADELKTAAIESPQKELKKQPVLPEPAPTLQKTLPKPPKPVVAKKVPKPKGPRPRPDYWAVRAQQFNRQLNMLNSEEDLKRRDKLIQNISQYVRVDTLSTIEWAMGLEDPEERYAALEAINKNALNGIGARIEMGPNGRPKIRETTILSAVGSSGQVEPGDTIAGIVKEDGTTVYFDGQTPRQIIQTLRGPPGTEVLLLMERDATENRPEPYLFDVPVQRSLLVVQPPE